MTSNLADIADYINEKINVSELDNKTYISTENMLPNRSGITEATTLPNTNLTSAFKVDDILVSNIRPYFKKIWHATFDGGCSNDVLIFRAKNKVDSKFLYYVLADDKFFDYSMSTAKGTKMPRGDKKSLMEYSVPDIDIEIQRKIAKVLSAIDDKIELNNSINNNLEQQAQVIFKSWFIDIKEANNYSEKFGNLPKNATLSRISDIDMIVTDYVANGSFASLKENVTLYQEPNYAYFVRNTDLKSNTFNVFVDEHSYKFLSKSVLHGNEIIISNVGDVGSVYLCPKLDKPMTLGNNIIMLRPNKSEILYYLYIWFKWSYGQGLIQGIKGGSAQPKFNKTDFKSLPIVLPSDDMLNNFSQIVAPMFKIIENNHRENTRLIQLRDALLPKLMSGEIDVDKVEV